MDAVTIKPFKPTNQQAVRALILAGLEEHWGFLEESKNPDLEDITNAYANGVFLVAWFNNEPVGTGAYLPRSKSVVEIVRMSVVKEMRRRGIGRKILAELCQRARLAGYKRAILETTRTWKEAIAFYDHFGFNFTHYQGEDAYFSLNLTKM